MSELHTKRPMYDVPIVMPVFPHEADKLSIADVGAAVFQAMFVSGVTEAKAKCPFCTDGYLHAGRFGNARRARVQCDTCGRHVVESFRSAMHVQIEGS